MYNGFFGFKEKPFNLIPNPDFLFLGKSHEEALAHLTYATSQGDGFVEITGEVGTGKTTLCRVFLEDLDQTVKAAYIFNPKLSAVQLLKELHSELQLEITSNDTVDLIHSLNSFLLKMKSEAKSVILLIDEAQHLDKETLEQLRMLSNLETTKSKLLQIILVGQPELGEMLDSFEMRQLRQRINLSCHLLPLTLKETREYISHRIQVASRKSRELFSSGAISMIFNYSGGIPRKINIICDRALLVAYSKGRLKINRNILRIAMGELQRPKVQRQPFSSANMIFFYTAVIICILTVLGSTAVFFLKTQVTGMDLSNRSVVDTAPPISTPADPKIPKDPVMTTQEKHAQRDFVTAPFLNQPQQNQLIPTNGQSKNAFALSVNHTGMNRLNAFQKLLSLWNIKPLPELKDLHDQIQDDAVFFRVTAMQNHFLIVKPENGIAAARQFSLPSLFILKNPAQFPERYLLLDQITYDNHFIFKGSTSEKKITLQESLVYDIFETSVYTGCRNLFGTTQLIGRGSSQLSILSVKVFLKKLGYKTIALTPEIDFSSQHAIKEIQAKHGLVPDGIVGPITQLAFTSAARDAGTPFLMDKKPETDSISQKDLQP